MPYLLASHYRPIKRKLDMHYEINNKWWWLSFLLLAILFSLRIAFAAGGIATDGTVGPAQTLSGTNVTIPQNLGTTVGNNLFHSFTQFNVNTGQTVTFTENTPNALDNVVSRVTGGTQSDINGTLASTPGGHANFYLVNPSGVVFGQNAQINVPGAFHASTADDVRFQDGAKFSASQPATSTLTAAAPASFGFLGTSSTTNGLLKVDAAQLTVKQGQTLDMVGGKIIVENGATLSAPTGEVRLVAKQGAGEVSLQRDSAGNLPLPTDAPSAANAGDITVNDSTIKTVGDGGSRIGMWGGNTSLNNTWIASRNNGLTDATAGKNIEIRANTLAASNSSSIWTDATGAGKAGNVSVVSTGSVALTNASTIESDTYGAGDAGTVNVNAESVNLDSGSAISASPNILSDSTGNAGHVIVKASGDITVQDSSTISTNALHKSTNPDVGVVEVDAGAHLQLLNGGEITAKTNGEANAGQVKIQADRLTVDGYGFDSNLKLVHSHISSDTSGLGNAGNIGISASGAVAVSNGGYISSNSMLAKGNAGNIDITANQLTVDGYGFDSNFKPVSSHISSETSGAGNAGSLKIVAGNALNVSNSGYISSKTTGEGDGGTLRISAKAINISNGGSINSDSASTATGNAGNMNVETSGNITLSNLGAISTDSYGTGNAGQLYVKAGSLSVNKSQMSSSDNGQHSGHGGDFTIDVAGDISIVGGVIGSSTDSAKNAGNVLIKAANIYIDGQNDSAGILSEASGVSKGNAGNIEVDIANMLSLKNGGGISSSVLGTGNAGNILVTVGNLLIDDQGSNGVNGITSQASSQSGNAGNITLGIIGNVDVNKGQISSDSRGSGNAGDITVTAGNISLKQDGKISSSTFALGNAGKIAVNSSNLSIDGQGQQHFTGISSAAVEKSSGEGGILGLNLTGTLAIANGGGVTTEAQSSGSAGQIEVSADKISLTNAGLISSSAFSSGNAGSVYVKATNIYIDGQNQSTGIASEAALGSSGKAGDIVVNVSSGLSLSNTGGISSSAAGTGSAGNVLVDTGTLSLNNSSYISAVQAGLGGQTGNITVNASDSIHLSNQGKISIENFANVANPTNIKAGNITVSAPDIYLMNSNITTQSTGNVDAGNIKINFSDQLFLDPSFISTEANNGNGGNITIQGGQLIQLINSGFKTSVLGQQSGNGGNISVTSECLVMETGLIQANTAAPRASGGDITLNIQGLIPSGDTLIKGGDQPVAWEPYVFGLNVIQAAAPNGVSGRIQLTAPQLNLSGVLSNLGGPQFDTRAISQDYCSLGTGSSLTRNGNGGLLPRSRDSLMY